MIAKLSLFKRTTRSVQPGNFAGRAQQFHDNLTPRRSAIVSRVQFKPIKNGDFF